MSGLIGDARTLVDHARLEAQNHRFTYDEPIGVEALTQSVCDLALGFGEGSDDNKKKQMSRPFGVALLMAGHDENGPQLYFSDPSGNYLQYKAKAIGAGSEGAQSTLQDKFRDDMSLLEAEDLAFEILKQVMEDKVSNSNIEMATVTDQGYRLFGPAQLDEVIRRSQ
ncbi:PAE1 [Symbiodinium microadriaticum]|nr:PAE1 [Symbiodinium microadriaticum]